MTLQTKLKSLYEPITAIACDVYHLTRGDARPPYIVWSEEGEDRSFNTDNHKAEQQLTGVIDFYTLDEFDPIADEIQAVLNEEPVGYILAEVQYEDQTNLTHYQWRWWTVG